MFIDLDGKAGVGSISHGFKNVTSQTLIAWRQQLHLSKVAAAWALGVSRASIARWERGEYPVPRHIALACAAIALGIPEAP